MPARTLMVQGTASHVGKSVLTAALCRLLARRGVRVAPFKALNMSNNACVTAQGEEIAAAQAAQARACGILPEVEMNPVLLKPTADHTSQVILNGRPRAQVDALSFPELREELARAIQDALSRLMDRYDVVVMEGAGSPAEVNLAHWDLANMWAARVARAAVLLVGDIERGGVFAQIVGTLALLQPEDRQRVRGIVINKFRGQFELLEPGLRWLEKETGLPVLGVLPFLFDLDLPEEDALADRLRQSAQPPAGAVQIQVIRFPTIANFTDFDPLHREPAVSVRYLSQDPGPAVPLPDELILPGTKSTLADLAWMRRQGLDRHVHRCAQAGVEVLGICGGFQMLGTMLYDPAHVESEISSMPGLGLLPTSTLFLRSKVTAQVEGVHLESGQRVRGYEIHAGRIQGAARAKAVFELRLRAGKAIRELEGCRLADQNVWGTFLHGLFEEPTLRQFLLDRIRRRTGKTVPLPPESPAPSHSEELSSCGPDGKGNGFKDPYDRLADEVEKHLSFSRLEQELPWIR